MARLFAPENRDATVERLLEAAGALRGDAARVDQVRRKVTKAGTELRRLQDAIKAGANPAELVDAINGAQERLEAARAELERIPAGRTLNRADVHAMIDYLGDVGGVVRRGEPAELQDLYESLHLEMIYQPGEQAVDVTGHLGGRGSTRDRGPSGPKSPRSSNVLSWYCHKPGQLAQRSSDRASNGCAASGWTAAMEDEMRKLHRVVFLQINDLGRRCSSRNSVTCIQGVDRPNQSLTTRPCC